MNKEPKIRVGILNETIINFRLYGNYKTKQGNILSDSCIAQIHQNGISVSCADNAKISLDSFDILEPADEKNCFFELVDVTIGVEFHWQRKENQRFKGALQFIIENKKITAVNIINIEDYLTCVISAEMSATSSMELLKAHAVISRGWLLAQIKKSENIGKNKTEYKSISQTETEYIRWWDREDHSNFDVCADDHCQRYQGITRANTTYVVDAIEATRGLVLTADGKICDARFSKSCGGVMEKFENTWEPVEHSYLQGLADTDDEKAIDLTIEENAEKWIRTSPESFCNTNDKTILSQVLNDYDRETSDFYRWKVEYTQSQISELAYRRSGFDFGEIIDIIPIQRGSSGRIIKLKIIGTKLVKIIGKELMIRRTFSNTHLYSSAFVVEKDDEKNGIPQKFTFIGAGWGHGVGLCQIGAAVMGAKGYSYDKILAHYFPNSKLEKLY
ncbi:MAG: SpoIID/LytB domain-containing protein [Prevotellaceae bacterium]|jgi:SpoIID/LytB domain protein|nr:SpoIID/LytB domain-containing protein [Prevotellaceae bacterium]